jgi:cyclophilin family peptidyl-prolyl cis-trans isomerase
MNPFLPCGINEAKFGATFKLRPSPIMNYLKYAICVSIAMVLVASGLATPVIDPIANVTVPAGKSLILPVTATSTTGLPLTYSVVSSTNSFAVVVHTNNPFWQLSVAQAAASNAPGAYQTPFRGGEATVTNVGNLTFMLFPEYAPHTLNVFQGLTTSAYFNSNTIFHRVVTNFVIQGGDARTNGSGHLVFTYDDEFNPQAIFSGNGQLGLANSGKNANGSQFFVTTGSQRALDFGYTLFGQLVRGFDVLTNISNTAVDTNSRPLADVIIQQAVYVMDTTDAVLTLTATNRAGRTGTITVIATDSAGASATNTFTAATVNDTNSNNEAFFYTNTVTKLVGPKNTTLTNFITATELDGDQLYWFPGFADPTSANGAPNSSYNLSNSIYKTLTYNVTNVQGKIQLFLVPATNYVGPVRVYFDVSYNSQWNLYQQYGLTLPAYGERLYTFAFGDTPITGQSNQVSVLAAVPFANVLLATFTNGVPGSAGTNFTAVINWGDNSTNSVIATTNSTGLKGVLGSHAYTYPGTYPVYVQVQSAIGASATILSFVNVTNQLSPATNQVTVQVAGQGTVLPGYTNGTLVMGDSYSITAYPSNLWFLMNWTDQNGFVLGTSSNLTFTMSPGLSLTANFAVIAQPTLTIVSPTNGQLITNLYSTLPTVTGTAADNAIVASVWYQANAGGWQQATGTTSWAASFVPQYGVTNVFQAYSVNNFGYVSTTNVLFVKYLAGAYLTIRTNGLGSIVPNLNQQLLPLGTNYALTVTPRTGFVVSNWMMFTNGLGAPATNSATLQFTMATNLTLLANLTDVSRPTNTITAPTNGQHMTNALATIVGTAIDNWGLAGVWYQLNNGAWTAPATANSWSNWTARVELQAGANSLKAYAVDLGGNFSATNSVSIISSNTFKLQLAFTNAVPLRTNGLAFSLQLSTGLNGYILYSTDLVGWNILTNFVGTNVTLNFRDPAATNSSQRFYRAVVP